MALIPPRICHVGTVPPEEVVRAMLARVRGLGFSHVLLRIDGVEPGPGTEALASLAEACEESGLSLLAELSLFELPPEHPLVRAHPDCFSLTAEAADAFVDPRRINATRGRATLRAPHAPEPFIGWWAEACAKLSHAGVQGFLMLQPQRLTAEPWRELLGRAKEKAQAPCLFIAETAELAHADLRALRGAGFDFSLSSLPWWDGRAAWLAEEHRVLAQIAPALALIETPGAAPPASGALRRMRLAAAAISGTGVMMPIGFEEASLGGADLSECVRVMNQVMASEITAEGALLSLTGPGDPITVLMRADAPDARVATRAHFAFINPERTISTEIGDRVSAALGDWSELEPLRPFADGASKLSPGEVRLFRARRAKPVVIAREDPAVEARAAARESRLVIANVAPSVDDGAYPAKAIVGETVVVEADIFCDGHPVIAAELLYRAQDESHWRRKAMRPLGNDRWTASFSLTRIGRHRFAIEAWIDSYGSFLSDLAKKRAAGTATALDIDEGRVLIEAAHARASGAARAPLAAILSALDTMDGGDRMVLLTAPETVEAMRNADPRLSKAESRAYVIEAERGSARFASWYELFPRSQTSDASRHGTFADVIARLPAIAEMGFDVLYMPPIHPIGRTNRKGRNNMLAAGQGDPGSPYAIGAVEGGHTAIHPELGTLADFRALVTAAHRHGIEIALDFAIQCSPDHPWLKEHPGWFDWRPDGTIKYAENPPKKYEDIVNVDFYAKDAIPDLWLALRDVVLFWIGEGVRLFRVDNPHTKPFAFWRWMIEDVRGRHPEVIFLSEAFTRPKVMYHLAKLGFSQSYTYFTWRNTKAELMAYMRELSTPPVADFFRPHFFVNTPDINPFFLQTSGRAGFLIRAALATTLSGLWGMYSGFELCESEALPGREEYKDSEKYEIKPRDWNAPGNIIAEITTLNRLRRSEPALQTHLGITFYRALNDNILYFGKHVRGSTHRLLVAISLNPHGVEEADFEIPLWEWSLPDSGALTAHDLLRGGSFVWHGKIQHMRLVPEAPYAIWRVCPAESS